MVYLTRLLLPFFATLKLLFLPSVVQGQFISDLSEEIDSLYSVVYSHTEHDTNKIKSSLDLADLYYYYDLDSTRKYTLLTLERIKTLNLKKHNIAVRIKAWKADAFTSLAYYYDDIGLVDSAIFYHNQSLKLNSELGNIEDVASSYSDLGIALNNSGRIEDAKQVFIKGIKISKENKIKLTEATNLVGLSNIQDDEGDYINAISSLTRAHELFQKENHNHGVSTCLLNIASIYTSIDNLDKAMEFNLQALSLKNKNGNNSSLDVAYHNVATILIEKNQLEKAEKYLDSAITIVHAQENPYGLTANYNTKGFIYYKKNQIDSAKLYYGKALKIAEEYDIISEIIILNERLGYVEFELGNFINAINYVNHAYDMSKNNSFYERLGSSSRLLSKIYERQGNYKIAFEKLQEAIVIQDSLVSDQNKSKAIQSQYQYEYDKKAIIDSIKFLDKEKLAKAKLDKQKAISIQRKTELQNKRTQQYALFGGLALILIFSGFLFKRYKLTQKQKSIIEGQKTQVESQKKEVEAQRDYANKQRQMAEHRKEELEEKNREITESISYAQRLQEAILPPKKLVKEWLTDSFLFYKPKDIVAGDFYWMETVDVTIGKRKKSLVFFAAADCTGHGVPGAMVSVVCANALNRAVKEFQKKDPGEVLDQVTELVVESFSQSDLNIKDGMDVALCALDIANKKLYFSGANNPLYIITNLSKDSENNYISKDKKRELIEYKGTRQAVGKNEHTQKFKTIEIELNPQDCIYIFSDGFADQFGGDKGKKYKYSNFKRFLLENSDQSMDDQKTELEKEFAIWRRDLEQIDDVCIIGVKINGEEKNNFTKREMEVLLYIKEGLPSKLIADKMNIAKSTVDTYRKRLLAKTGTYNAVELINYCLDKEVI